MAGSWSELSSRRRGLIIAAGVLDAAGKTVALVDLRRRPGSQIRGPKWMWAALVLVNFAGLTSLSYLLFGRRRATP